MTKEVTLKGLEKRLWRDVLLTGSTWPPGGHSVTQQLRSNCDVLLYTSAGPSRDANNSLSLWKRIKTTGPHKMIVLPHRQNFGLISSLPSPRRTDGNNAPKCYPWLDEALNTCKNGPKKLIISLPADNSLETKEMGVTYVLVVFTTARISRTSCSAEKQLTQSR